MSDKITLEDVRLIRHKFAAVMPHVPVAVITDEIHVEVVAGETG